MQNNSSRVQKFGDSKRKQRQVMEEGQSKDNRKRKKIKRERQQDYEYDDNIGY